MSKPGSPHLEALPHLEGMLEHCSFPTGLTQGLFVVQVSQRPSRPHECLCWSCTWDGGWRSQGGRPRRGCCRCPSSSGRRAPWWSRWGCRWCSGRGGEPRWAWRSLLHRGAQGGDSPPPPSPAKGTPALGLTTCLGLLRGHQWSLSFLTQTLQIFLHISRPGEGQSSQRGRRGWIRVTESPTKAFSGQLSLHEKGSPRPKSTPTQHSSSFVLRQVFKISFVESLAWLVPWCKTAVLEHEIELEGKIFERDHWTLKLCANCWSVDLELGDWGPTVAS